MKRVHSPTNPAPTKHIFSTWLASCARFSDDLMQSCSALLARWFGLSCGEPDPELGGDVSGVPRIHTSAVQVSDDVVPGLTEEEATDCELGGDRTCWSSRKLKDGNGTSASGRARLIASACCRRLCDDTLAAIFRLELDLRQPTQRSIVSRAGDRAASGQEQLSHPYMSAAWNP